MKAKSAIPFLLMLLPLTALADNGSGDRMAQLGAQLEKRFAAADTNSDKQLTRDEAKAGMPMVYRQFDGIDSERRGYVTLEQVRIAIQNRAMTRGNSRGGAASEAQ